MVNRSCDSIHLYLVPDLRGKQSVFHHDVSCMSVLDAPYQVKEVSRIYFPRTVMNKTPQIGWLNTTFVVSKFWRLNPKSKCQQAMLHLKRIYRGECFLLLLASGGGCQSLVLLGLKLLPSNLSFYCHMMFPCGQCLYVILFSLCMPLFSSCKDTRHIGFRAC